MMKEAPQPQTIIELVKCGCRQDRCSDNRCQCRKAGLSCMRQPIFIRFHAMKVTNDRVQSEKKTLTAIRRKVTC